MDAITEALLKKLLPKNANEIQPYYDLASNTLYLQTAPYLEDGKIVITRVAKFVVEIKDGSK